MTSTSHEHADSVRRATSHEDDLALDQFSDALKGMTLDLVVTGSIGAVEAPRFARCLRRLGADVHAVLTKSAQMFTTTTAMEWATARPCVTGFEGLASHLARHHALVVAPCSAQFIHDLAHGCTSTPATSLAASYLGLKRPVILVPNMHDSLFQSPAVQENLAKVAPWVSILDARLEEGKHKFPTPKVLADQVAHRLQTREDAPHVLISMGSTRGYFDDVRYISNYSSGALGTHIAEEAYRQGLATTVIAGECLYKPQVASKLIHISTYDELRDACLAQMGGHHVGVFAASVLDFVPKERHEGKTPSGQALTVTLEPTKKILGMMQLGSQGQGSQGSHGFKVGFKLESQLSRERATELAKEYMAKYQLGMFVANGLNEVDSSQHRALLFVSGTNGTNPTSMGWISGKQNLAQAIVSQIIKHCRQSH